MMSSREIDMTSTHGAGRLAIARQKLSGRRSSSTVLNQVCLGLRVLRRQSLGRTPNAGLKSPRMVFTGVGTTKVRWPKKQRRRRRTVSDKSGWPVRDRTTSL